MLQRANEPKDPARGKLEFPGGCLEPGEDAQDCAVREWEEETGQKLPKGRFAGSWTSPNGVYRGILYFVPSEDSVPVGALRNGTVKNPDDEDHGEAILWVDPRLIKDNVLTRKEVRKSTDWDVLNSKPQASDRETAQNWNPGRIGPDRSMSPLHHGPEGPSTPAAPAPSEAERFPESFVTVRSADGKSKQLKVAVADSPARRAIGLQNTGDLTGSETDGLLMTWPSETTAKLQNANIVHPVGAVFFDSQGMYRDHFLMNADDPTPKTAKASHRYALEVHGDKMDSFGLGPGCSLDLGTDPDSATQLS